MLYIYMGAAIFYLLSIGGAGWYGLEQGRKLEKSEWQEKELKRGEEINAGVKKNNAARRDAKRCSTSKFDCRNRQKGKGK